MPRAGVRATRMTSGMVGLHRAGQAAGGPPVQESHHTLTHRTSAKLDTGVEEPLDTLTKESQAPRHRRVTHAGVWPGGRRFWRGAGMRRVLRVLAGCAEAQAEVVAKTLDFSKPVPPYTFFVECGPMEGNAMYPVPLAGNANLYQQGEVLEIEVSPGRYLSAVVAESKSGEESMFFPDDWMLDAARKLHTVKGKPMPVAQHRYPLVVTFGDLKDPKSVREVDPFNLQATFGPGYMRPNTVESRHDHIQEG